MKGKINNLLETKEELEKLAYKWNSRDGTGQDYLDPTGKFQNHRRLTGRSTGFLQKVFVHCSMYLIKNFQKGGHE